MQNKKQAVSSDAALGFVVLCLAVYILHEASAIMIPFMIALFVWYLINAIARVLSRAVPKLPGFFCFFLAILSLVGGLWFVSKLISANAADVMRAAPVYQAKFAKFLPELLSSVPEAYRPNPGEIASWLNVNFLIAALVKTFSGIAGKALVVLFYTGFLLYEQRFFGRKLREMAGSDAAEARVHKVIRNIDVKIQRYIGVKTFASVMTGIFTWLALVSFKVDFAEFWGVMAFILNFIPYVGSLVAIILPSIIALVQLTDISTLAGVMGSLCIVQVFWGSIVEPRLLGDNLNLSPIFIIFSLAAWGMIWGVPGMFLSIPILAMIVITLAQFDATRPVAVLLSKTGDIEDGAGRKG